MERTEACIRQDEWYETFSKRAFLPRAYTYYRRSAFRRPQAQPRCQALIAKTTLMERKFSIDGENGAGRSQAPDRPCLSVAHDYPVTGALAANT